MKTDISHLPAEKQNELNMIVELIRARKKYQIEMVILFGSYARGTWVEDRYIEYGSVREYKSDFDILVVVSVNDKYMEEALESKLSNDISELETIKTPVSIIVHDITFVNRHLEQAQYFFSDIYKEGIKLHDSGNCQLTEPTREIPPTQRAQLAVEDFDYWFASANHFLEVFLFCFQQGKYNNAAFELHQVAERLYTTILLVYSHYKPNTHNIIVLRKVAGYLDKRFNEAFPTATREDRRLLDILKRAYIDARYKRDYSIAIEDLTELQQRVECLKKLTEKWCQEKISSLKPDSIVLEPMK